MWVHDVRFVSKSKSAKVQLGMEVWHKKFVIILVLCWDTCRFLQYTVYNKLLLNEICTVARIQGLHTLYKAIFKKPKTRILFLKTRVLTKSPGLQTLAECKFQAIETREEWAPEQKLEQVLPPSCHWPHYYVPPHPSSRNIITVKCLA